MLPTRLLSWQRANDGDVVPTWLTPRDEVWLRELVAEAGASDGRRVDAAAERILDCVTPLALQHGRSRRVVEAIWLLERRRWRSRIDAPAAPERIRQVLFDLAAERSREESLAHAAAELGIPEETVLPSLFADRAGARRLVAPPEGCSPAGLVDAYNLALAQALLARSTLVVALVRANLRPVVRYAKLHGLMAKFEENAEGVTRISLSGPLALFHDTLKYGRALATWLPTIITTPGWQLEARVVLGEEALRLSLDASTPLPRTHALPRVHDSKLEARFEKDLRRLASRWSVVREASAVRTGQRVFYPDFALTAAGHTVLVEIVGFWTPEYLAEKAALLRAATVPIVLCVDARHATGTFEPDPRIVPFRGAIDAAAVVAACERILAAPPTPPIPRHYLLIPASGAMKTHAVRAGADADRWREELFEDLTRDCAMHVSPSGAHSRYGRQLGIWGQRFYAQANLDGRREDALFVHRVMRASERPTAPPPRRVEAAYALLDPATAAVAKRVERVAPLFEQVATG
jgi:hypothetical protein